MVKHQTRFDFQEAILSGIASTQFNSLLERSIRKGRRVCALNKLPAATQLEAVVVTVIS
jgi:hypothetical protein